MSKNRNEPTEAFRARVALRASGAAGLHNDTRERRARTRNASLRRALRDQD